MVKASSLSCPSCGAGIELHAEGWAVTVACGTCGSVLDALDPNLTVLQEHARRMPFKPSIPLGTRGKVRGVQYEMIGCQRVTITVEGIDYSWTEYVCFNPYHGFLYLSEYEGHWNVIEKLRRPPSEQSGLGRTHAMLDGRKYHHFQSAMARTSGALGEFPWELRVGDTIQSRDFVSPPFLLSAEGTQFETTWSRGEYTPPSDIAEMFGVPSIDKRPNGVFANQPNPHVRSARRIRRVGVWLVAVWALMLVGSCALTSNEVAYDEQGLYYDRARGEANAMVTDPFELKGRASNVRIEVQSNVQNDWVWFALALIDERSGQARDVSVQTSFYSGTDSDGSWTEGKRSGDVTLSSVPSGRYVLRIAPEGGEPTGSLITYSVKVRRDVPVTAYFVLAFFALTVPMIVAWFPAVGFENRRWMESDHEGVMLSFPSEQETA